MTEKVIKIYSAEVKSDEGSLLSKRMPDLTSQNQDNIQEKMKDSNKKQKFEISSADDSNPLIPEVEENKEVNGTENISIQGDVNKGVEEAEEDEDEEDYEAEGEDDDNEDEDEDEEDDEEDDSDDDHSNGNAEVVDRKGKGIMTDDKGKGKLIEESEDSKEQGSESDGDSDLSDDPLAEVDLDNILPTRTRSRRRVVQPGIHIADNQGLKEDDNDDSDDN